MQRTACDLSQSWQASHQLQEIYVYHADYLRLKDANMALAAVCNDVCDVGGRECVDWPGGADECGPLLAEDWGGA